MRIPRGMAGATRAGAGSGAGHRAEAPGAARLASAPTPATSSSRRFIPPLCRSAADENRDLRVREHFLGLAAEQQRAHAAAAVRGHDDQVAALVARGIDDAA